MHVLGAKASRAQAFRPVVCSVYIGLGIYVYVCMYIYIYICIYYLSSRLRLNDVHVYIIYIYICTVYAFRGSRAWASETQGLRASVTFLALGGRRATARKRIKG